MENQALGIYTLHATCANNAVTIIPLADLDKVAVY